MFLMVGWKINEIYKKMSVDLQLENQEGDSGKKEEGRDKGKRAETSREDYNVRPTRVAIRLYRVSF